MLLSQSATRKMKADYFRYLAEFAKDDAKREHAANAEGAYKQATESASSLAPTHPIRLGLALNFSVFLYEVQGDQSQACTLATARKRRTLVRPRGAVEQRACGLRVPAPPHGGGLPSSHACRLS